MNTLLTIFASPNEHYLAQAITTQGNTIFVEQEPDPRSGLTFWYSYSSQTSSDCRGFLKREDLFAALSKDADPYGVIWTPLPSHYQVNTATNASHTVLLLSQRVGDALTHQAQQHGYRDAAAYIEALVFSTETLSATTDMPNLNHWACLFSV